MNTYALLDIKTASFIFGALLVLVALFGGGIKVKELTIPQVGRRLRIVAGLIGPLFILYAMASSFEFGSSEHQKDEGHLVELHSPAIKSVLGRAVAAESTAPLLSHKSIKKGLIPRELVTMEVRPKPLITSEEPGLGSSFYRFFTAPQSDPET